MEHDVRLSDLLILSEEQYTNFSDSSWHALRWLDFSEVVFLPSCDAYLSNPAVKEARAVCELLKLDVRKRTKIWIGTPKITEKIDDLLAFSFMWPNTQTYLSNFVRCLKKNCEEEGIEYPTNNLLGICLNCDSVYGEINHDEQLSNLNYRFMVYLKDWMFKSDYAKDFGLQQLSWIPTFPIENIDEMEKIALACDVAPFAGISEYNNTLFDVVYIKPHAVYKDDFDSIGAAYANIEAVFLSVENSRFYNKLGTPIFPTKNTLTSYGFVMELDGNVDPSLNNKCPEMFYRYCEKFNAIKRNFPSAFFWKNGAKIIDEPIQSCELTDYYVNFTGYFYMLEE